jgi:hypothetical protein
MKEYLQLKWRGNGKELSTTPESYQEKSVQEKDREEPAKELDLQIAAGAENHCLKESFDINQ